MKIAPAQGLHISERKDMAAGTSSASQKKPFWKRINLALHPVRPKPKAANANSKSLAPADPTLASLPTEQPQQPQQPKQPQQLSSSATSTGTTIVGIGTIAATHAIRQSWGEGFDGLEIEFQEYTGDISGSNNDQDHNDCSLSPTELEYRPTPIPDTSGMRAKRHGSIWHKSVNDNSVSASTTGQPRAMRSRASLVRIAMNIEFDSEAFSECESEENK